MNNNIRHEALIVATIVLFAFLLRSVGHSTAPNGWRDDELSNALVVSQHVLNGEVRLYYDDASGHEGLYHWLQAGTMAIFGPGVWGIRGVSIVAGTAAVALTYFLTRRMYDAPTAIITSLALAVAFWSLVYSRSGQRHVMVTVTTLTSFLLLWHAIPREEGEPYHLGRFMWAGVALGVGFYTYFASRGVPLIVIAWVGFLFLWRRELFKQVWWRAGVMLGVAALFAVPLALTLQQQPEAEARIAELAKPIYDARDGDFSTIAEYTVTTLSMFTHSGDDEVLYNIPFRPVFGPLGGALFWAGVMLALMRAVRDGDPRDSFLLLWLGAGLAPGVLSVPAASLGHTILAQTPTMIFPALALVEGGRWLAKHRPTVDARSAVLGLAILFLGWEAVRDIRDYWFVWPTDGFNRVLHHSDLHEGAQWLNENEQAQDVVIGGFLAERWDQQAMALSLQGEAWRIRAVDPRSAVILLPEEGYAVIPEYLQQGWGVQWSPSLHDEFGLYRTPPTEIPAGDPLAAFANNLTLQAATIDESEGGLVVITTWVVTAALDLPAYPLLSKPPAPDEDDTPRLRIFTQVLTPAGEFITGNDLLGVDPYTLQPGDAFMQRVPLDISGLPPGEYTIVTGLYDPATGVRVLTGDGKDRVEIHILTR